jgi:acetylornithine/N-succinyldiaminopimelate aminotransferase
MSSQAPSPLMSIFATQAVAFERGDGVWIYDTQGRRYLDGLAGIAVNTLGHNHPVLTAALHQQVSTMMHHSNLFEAPLQKELAQRLVDRSGMTNAFFCNSGLEANEAAIKLARLYGHNRGIALPEIIVYDKAFHGRSLATLSATGNEKVQKGFEPLVTGFVRVPLNDINRLREVAASHPNVVAVFLEGIQGEGGIVPARIDYLQQVRELCNQREWLMMVDEVQCGMGRTGKWFSYQWAGIIPDVVPMAKGLGSGVPIGAILGHNAAASVFKPGNHGSTFGGNPLAMRAGITTIDVMDKDGLLANAAAIGQLLKLQLHEQLSGTPGYVEVRGQGLMLGIQLDRPCAPIVKMALDAGLVINVTADSVVRLLPALIYTREHAETLISILVPVIKAFLGKTP